MVDFARDAQSGAIRLHFRRGAMVARTGLLNGNPTTWDANGNLIDYTVMDPMAPEGIRLTGLPDIPGARAVIRFNNPLLVCKPD